MSKNNVYDVPDFIELEDNHTRILAFDPGSVNMGCSLLDIDRSSKKIKVLANTVLMNPIHDIKQFSKERKLFLEEISSWVAKGKPKAIVAERFQSRGLRGTTIECVCMMLGMLSMLSLPFYFITASTWKNAYQRRFAIDLKDIYQEINVVPHILDSALIGCYGIEQGTHRQISFTIDSIIDDVESVSLIGYTK